MLNPVLRAFALLLATVSGMLAPPGVSWSVFTTMFVGNVQHTATRRKDLVLHLRRHRRHSGSAGFAQTYLTMFVGNEEEGRFRLARSWVTRLAQKAQFFTSSGRTFGFMDGPSTLQATGIRC